MVSVRSIVDRLRPAGVPGDAVLVVDVFGASTDGGWYASTRIIAAPPVAPAGLLAFATLRFVDDRLRAIGGQPLDGAIHQLRLLAAGGAVRSSQRHPLIGRYTVRLRGPGRAPADVHQALAGWRWDLLAKMAAVTGARATALQLCADARALYVEQIRLGLDVWVRERLRPARSTWEWQELWGAWVATSDPNWHKLLEEP